MSAIVIVKNDLELLFKLTSLNPFGTYPEYTQAAVCGMCVL